MTDHHYGVATREQIAGKSGLAILQSMLSGELPAPPISRQLSFWLTAVKAGEAIFEGEPKADYFNPMGTVHGGWALTLIDSATGCAAMTVLPAGSGYTTLETRANMTRAIMPDTGPVRCIGRVITQGRRIITADATLVDGRDRVLAHGSSTLLVLAP